MHTVSIPMSHIGLSTEEYMLKCKLDPKTFSRHFFKTTPALNGKPYQHQLDLLDLIDRNQFLSVNVSREVGTTSTLASYIAWQMTCSPNTTVAHISNCQGKSDQLLSMVHEFIESDVLWPITSRRYGINQLTTSSGSRFISNTHNHSDAFRGSTITTLIIERGYGYEDEWTMRLRNIMPALPMVSCNIIEIMPIHAESLFENSFTCRIPWSVMPHHTEERKQEIITQMGTERWLLEYGD